MKLKDFIKIFTLLLVCCTASVCMGKSLSPHSRYKRATISTGKFRPDNLPLDSYLPHSRLEGNQEITRQQEVHKNVNYAQVAYLLQRSGSASLKCLNFFSGYNNQRYTPLNKVFLFPFHVFW